MQAACQLSAKNGHRPLFDHLLNEREASTKIVSKRQWDVADLGAAGEIANVNHVFHPFGRYAASTS